LRDMCLETIRNIPHIEIKEELIVCKTSYKTYMFHNESCTISQDHSCQKHPLEWENYLSRTGTKLFWNLLKKHGENSGKTLITIPEENIRNKREAVRNIWGNSVESWNSLEILWKLLDR